jgi:hypothetical protein
MRCPATISAPSMTDAGRNRGLLRGDSGALVAEYRERADDDDDQSDPPAAVAPPTMLVGLLGGEVHGSARRR